MSDKRQQILEALEDVPKTLAMIERTLENFNADQTLSDLTVELYVRILKAIEGMMQWLVDKAGCEHGKFLGPFLSSANINKGNKSKLYFSVPCTKSRWMIRLLMLKIKLEKLTAEWPFCATVKSSEQMRQQHRRKMLSR